MPSGSLHRPRRSRRTTLRLLATLTLALALAGPANADSLGAEGIPDPETVLAAEVPEPPVEAPPDAPEPAVEPAEAPPAEPAPPAAEPLTLGAAEPAEPDEQADPAEEVATEPPAYIADEPESGLPLQIDEEDYAAPVVTPVNFNVDIRILSPGNDGDVSQVIDMGQLPGLGSGNPTDVLGGLGLGDLDLGLDWTWNWNWSWDCGDSSIAGLDWNWTWTWSGDCAAGLGEPAEGSMPLGERFRSDRYAVLLDALDPEALGAPSDMDLEGGLVGAPGAGGSTPAGRDEPDEALGVPAPSSHYGGFSTPAPAFTTFASTGATSRSRTAMAPARRPAGSDPNGDPERRPAGLPAQAVGLATASAGGGGGGGAFSVLMVAALVGALALVPPPPGGRFRALQQTLSSLLSSSRLERPG